jgi:hypothetical protein
MRESKFNNINATLLGLSDALTTPGCDDHLWHFEAFLIIVFMFILILTFAHKANLTTGFLAYFTDNVLVMLMADSASLVGTGFFWQLKEQYPICQQWLGLCVNTLLTLILWSVAKTYHGTGHATDTATHVLDMIPWIIKVGMLNLLSACHGAIWNGKREPDEMGEQFNYAYLIFICLFPMGWLFNSLAARLHLTFHKGEKYSLGTFLWATFNGGLESCTGKAMHYSLYVIIYALHDDNKPLHSLRAYGGMEIAIFVIASFLLMHILPRVITDSDHDFVSRDYLAFIIIYCWAFSFVDFTWWFFYTYLGANSVNGQFYFWMFIVFLLGLALLHAWCCGGNFYGGSSEVARGTANMLCWSIEFGAWWGWAQTMVELNGAISSYPGCSITRVFNLAMTLGLILITVAVQKLVALEEMLEHRSAKNSPMGPKEVPS